MKETIVSAKAPTSGDDKTKQQRETLEGLGIDSVDYCVNDYREIGDSPHSLWKVEVEAAFGIGERRATVLFQNILGDGKLYVGYGEREDAEDALMSLGCCPDADGSPWEQLTKLLAPTGILERAQEVFDGYLDDREPEVAEEIYRPEYAFGGHEFRAFLTTDDEVSIQSRPPEGDIFRSHGVISKDDWDGLGISDKGDPSFISGICNKLDDGEFHKPERGNEPER